MGIVTVLGLVLLFLSGLLIAFKGYDLLKSFVRMTGGVLLCISLMVLGLFIGALLGPVWAVVVPIAFGIAGFILGWLIAPFVVWLIVSIIVFSVFWGLGISVGEHFGAGGIVLYAIAFACGLLGAWVFAFLAKKILMMATSIVGGLMTAAALMLLFMGVIGIVAAGALAIASFVLVSLLGFIAQRKKGPKRSKGKKGKKGRKRR